MSADLMAVAKEEGLRRVALEVHIQSLLKQFEMYCLQGDYVRAEQVRDNIHTTQDVILDSIMKVCTSVRTMYGK